MSGVRGVVGSVWLGRFLGVLLLQGAVVACAPMEGPGGAEAVPTGARPQALEVGNGLSLNGLSLNGLSLNGLSLNGLSLNGLSTSAFATWFEQDAALGDEVMTYVVRCAVPEGESRTHTDARTGHTYTWWGLLGLAPDWAQGSPATLPEQQVISACLAAHVNKYGRAVSLSVLGRSTQGPVPFTEAELAHYSQREACFFGNLFNGEGLWAANDGEPVGEGESNARGCGRVSSGTAESPCPPMMRAPSCADVCQLDATGTYYTSCGLNGVHYRPITTRLRPEDVYQCGDGVCQFTESCGTGSESFNCAADCGPCP